ncbi:nucleotidyltransferase [Virgibacillus ihumii]|uniref:nucleotidyltransferase n=1 Tax=Virgibacillus ihumii TaxID=2686091 RepID=UPI00157CCF1E|nr:nucleotidyltransferase [Virgibacillus ihumii]
MTEIKNIGGFCDTDDTGYIINTACTRKISPAFHQVLNEMIQYYRMQLGKNLHSIYVRGSVPHGQAIYSVSDLDTLAIVNEEVDSMDLQWVEGIEQKINEKFPCINGVEFSFYLMEDVLETSTFSIIPFMLKTHSVCVYGEDLISLLPSYRADKTLANHHLINLKNQVDQAKKDLDDNYDTEDILDCCSWIMKIIVRAGLTLVMVEEKRYTRDLYPAYKLFSQYYPEKEPEMKLALQYAIEPITDTEELLHFLEQTGTWIITEAEEWLEIYNPYRVSEMELR